MCENSTLVPKGRLIVAQDDSPTSVNLFGVFFFNTSHKIVILSEAPHRFIAWYSAGRGVEEPVLSEAEGTSRGDCSTHAVGTLFNHRSPHLADRPRFKDSAQTWGWKMITVHEKMYPVTIKSVPQEEFSSRAWVVEKLRTALTR